MEQKGIQSKEKSRSKHKLAVTYYGEKMYFIDAPAQITAKEQTIFENLLDDNQGVGIIAGYFDEDLTIRMISGLAARLLGYIEREDVPEQYKTSLFGILITEDEREFFRNKLLNPDGQIWGYCLNGKDNTTVSVRIGNVIETDENGEKMWYMSIRRFGEFQYDNLTGAYNRSGFIRKVKELRDNGGDLTDYAILLTDISGFKAINDMYGSEVGDTLLMSIYNHFSTCKLKPVFCARKESDKFLLLVKKENLDLNTLPDVLKTPYTLGGESHIVKSVCGIYYINDNNKIVEIMVDCTKLARQHIQDAFVSPYAVFDPTMRADYLGHANAQLLFDEALANQEFKVYFQPIIDCTTEKIASAEALVRWESKEHGFMSPATFIPALEENGSIIKLDRYVCRYVIDILHKRAKNGEPIIPVSVNLSRMDFFDDGRMDQLYERLKTDELSRKYIRFEITETAHHTVAEAQAAFVKRVNSLGGMVYIDDFGVANSSLDMLSQYDFDVLKLDMQFIKSMLGSKKVQSLVRSTINMAHNLDLKVVAEGVETKEQLDMLRGFNCDYIQGYYFSKPLPEKEFEKFMMSHL